MRVLSLYNGISCGRVAFERIESKVDKYIAYETDEDVNKVAKFHFPEDHYYGDVFQGDFSKHQNIDIVIGGSPCTYWSIAKAGGQRETTSSGFGFELFLQYVRAIKETNPKYFLYENNASMSSEIKNEITKYLGVEPILIDSADFGAQERKRLYWTNIKVSKEWEKSTKVFKDIELNAEHKIYNYEKYKHTEKNNGKCYKWDTSGKGYYSQQSRARIKSVKMNTLPASGTDKNNIYLGNYTYRKIHPIEAERLQGLPDNYTKILKSKTKRLKGIGNGWTIDVIAYILSFMEE
jgi:DNA (cytosine-5)-methyltransferase 3A